MANECIFCRQRHIETNMLVLNGDWIEFCDPCGSTETLTNQDTGETITIKELFQRAQSQRTQPQDENTRESEKITKKAMKEFIRDKLANDDRWAKQALLKIFEFQTADEQRIEQTHLHNDVGFTGVDAHILTSLAKQLQQRGWLSKKQMLLLKKKMPKYWKQIRNISNEDKLKAQYQKWNKEPKQLKLELGE